MGIGHPTTRSRQDRTRAVASRRPAVRTLLREPPPARSPCRRRNRTSSVSGRWSMPSARRSRTSPTASGACPRSPMASTARSLSIWRRSKSEGFRITENLAGIPTAVMGEAGEGGPVIAILGEYDALPGLSPGGRHRRGQAAGAWRARPWLRAQPAGFGGPAGGDRGEGPAG